MTVKYQILYWRDIPAQVKARVGRERKSKPLPERFEKAIDRAAIYAGLTNSDDYLSEWRAGEWQERDGDPDKVVNELVAELDAAYPDARLQQMARNGGYDSA